MLGGAIGMAPGAWETFKSWLVGKSPLDGSHMKLKRDITSKESSFDGNMTSSASRWSTGPVIDADALKHTIWRSPTLQLSDKEKMLFSGAMSGSQAIAGSPYVTPADMARLTAGMGVGYASGLVVGRTLGVFAGMPKPTQDRIAQTGALAGVVKSALPLLYGYR
jgi:hypothetical protein